MLRFLVLIKARSVSALCAVALGAGLVAAPASPAAAVPNYHQADFSAVYGQFQFGSIGWLRGHLGRVHTGSLNLETDDDGITGSLWDWDCPSGVTRPTTVDKLGCTLLREVNMGQGSPLDGLADPTFTDALAGSFRNTGTNFYIEYDKDDFFREYYDTLDIAFRHRGPVTVTERFDDSRTRTVTHEGPMTLTGRVGAMIIENRGSSWVTTEYYQRDSRFYPRQ